WASGADAAIASARQSGQREFAVNSQRWRPAASGTPTTPAPNRLRSLLVAQDAETPIAVRDQHDAVPRRLFWRRDTGAHDEKECVCTGQTGRKLRFVQDHVAVVRGDVTEVRCPIVRVHVSDGPDVEV